MLRKLLTNLMLLSVLFTHAQCVKAHHSDGWTEEIPVNQIDSITFSDTITHLASLEAKAHDCSVPHVILRWHYQHLRLLAER